MEDDIMPVDSPDLKTIDIEHIDTIHLEDDLGQHDIEHKDIQQEDVLPTEQYTTPHEFDSVDIPKEDQAYNRDYPSDDDDEDDEIEFGGDVTLCCTNYVLMCGLYMVLVGTLFQTLGLILYHFFENWNYILYPTENNSLRGPLYISWVFNFFCTLFCVLVFTKRPTKKTFSPGFLHIDDSGKSSKLIEAPEYRETVWHFNASSLSLFQIFSQISLFLNGVGMLICSLIFTPSFEYLLLVPADRNAFLMFLGMGMVSFGSFMANQQYLTMDQWCQSTLFNEKLVMLTSGAGHLGSHSF